MLTEKSLNMIISTPAFIKNVNRLSYQLKMSRQDASQELLLELLDHRLRSWTDNDVEQAVVGDLPSLKWRIKYARKDIVRREFKDDKREQEKQEKAEMLTSAQQNNNADETLEALALIPDLFKNENTKNWVQSVLTVGKEQTMMLFHQSPRQFAAKLSKTCKYANEHRQKIGDIKMRQIDDDNMRELEVWNQFDQLIILNPQNIQRFITEHRELFDEVVNDQSIHQQGVLLNNFKQASDEDKKQLIVLIKKHVAELEHELTNREDK